jgi:NADPH-dependent ferric siderophore reductase
VRFVGGEPVSASFLRVTVEGDLGGYTEPLPADAFKLTLPSASGPAVRAYTVRDCNDGRLRFDVLNHAYGAGLHWLQNAVPGDEVSLLGFRTDFAESARSERLLVIADPAAYPAAATIIEANAGRREVMAVIDVPDDSDRLLCEAGTAQICWTRGAQLEAVRGLNLRPDGLQVWVAGETSLVSALRRYLLDEAGINRDELHAAGYWRAGKTYEQEFNDSLDRFNDAVGAGEDTTDPDVLQRRAFDSIEVTPVANGERP